MHLHLESRALPARCIRLTQSRDRCYSCVHRTFKCLGAFLKHRFPYRTQVAQWLVSYTRMLCELGTVRWLAVPVVRVAPRLVISKVLDARYTQLTRIGCMMIPYRVFRKTVDVNIALSGGLTTIPCLTTTTRSIPRYSDLARALRYSSLTNKGNVGDLLYRRTRDRRQCE